jgi:hypothetical protein
MSRQVKSSRKKKVSSVAAAGKRIKAKAAPLVTEEVATPPPATGTYSIRLASARNPDLLVRELTVRRHNWLRRLMDSFNQV